MSENIPSHKVAFIFPGQGSQYVGMGKDWYRSSPIARRLFDSADGVMGFHISYTCFDGTEEDLRKTAITQPAIFIHSAVVYEALREKLSSDSVIAAVAGHSLGEYTALFAAGTLGFEEGLRLVRLRGELMQWCGKVRPGTMAAVIGVSEDKVEEICKDVLADGIVRPANFNSPGQIVISGDVEAVHAAMEKCKLAGAKMVKELVVGGAFHSPLMEPALEEFEKALYRAEIKDPRFPVYSNVTAKPIQKATDVRPLLLQQLTNPVKWQQSIENMHKAGVNKFVELGPGKVLQGLVKRTCSDCETIGIDKFSELGAFTL